MALKIPSLTKKHRLLVTIGISFSFFLAELIFGFRTGSLALIADAFHYLNDLIGFIVALAAVMISERSTTPKALSFGWQRGQLLGGFFNGVFLLALGISIFLQSIERFIELKHVEDPMIVLILGSVGLFLNIVSLLFLHDHGHDHGHGQSHEHNHALSHDEEQRHDITPKASQAHSHNHELSDQQSIERHHEHRHATIDLKDPGYDLGMLGVVLHIMGDAVNNIGVMIAALVIWKTNSGARFYADPAVSLFIAIMIFASAFPLVKSSGSILLQTAPLGVSIDDIQHDLEKIPGIESVHELHVWRLNERKSIASVHVVVSDESVPNFIKTAKHINECLHAYGIHSTTLQPELSSATQLGPRAASETTSVGASSAVETHVDAEGQDVRRRVVPRAPSMKECQLICTKLCEGLMCCNLTHEV
ncbi:hypothetical protein jhhlp_005906 [Lomentospora prolificans]|uniref:Cation efflux protein cytoplasmic domain-containing protein n=1 Tax=Lomentospora prolificans TaxID=41688 RepID=A0A2N3N4G0_9PEZI|nr:hypothetical protein jhhlp_005906 [Lomentospora prolificans]